MATSTKDVQKHLEKTVQQGEAPANQQLIFDPHTGELVVQSTALSKPNPDAVVADQITEDGFFQN